MVNQTIGNHGLRIFWCGQTVFPEPLFSGGQLTPSFENRCTTKSSPPPGNPPPGGKFPRKSSIPGGEELLGI